MRVSRHVVSTLPYEVKLKTLFEWPDFGECVSVKVIRLNSPVEQNEHNFLKNIETRAMIATLSADRSLVEVAGLRDEATEQGQIAGYGAERITSFGRQSARVTARPAWTGKPRRRRIVSDCRPVAVRAPLALDSPGRRAIGKRSAGDRPYASRPEMAPQVFGKARFAPGNGAPPGPSIRKPAACCLRFAVERPMRVARNSQGGPCGSRASPTDFVPRRQQVAFLSNSQAG